MLLIGQPIICAPKSRHVSGSMSVEQQSPSLLIVPSTVELAPAKKQPVAASGLAHRGAQGTIPDFLEE